MKENLMIKTKQINLKIHWRLIFFKNKKRYIYRDHTPIQTGCGMNLLRRCSISEKEENQTFFPMVPHWSSMACISTVYLYIILFCKEGKKNQFKYSDILSYLFFSVNEKLLSLLIHVGNTIKQYICIHTYIFLHIYF